MANDSPKTPLRHISVDRKGNIEDSSKDWRELTEVESLKLKNAALEYATNSAVVAKLESDLALSKAERQGALVNLESLRKSFGVENPKSDIKEINGTFYVRIKKDTKDPKKE